MTSLPPWIEEIKKRYEAATPGPWYVNDKDGIRSKHLDEYKYDTTIVYESEPSEGLPGVLGDNNPSFIANARTDIPKLISALEDAMKTLGDLIQVCAGATDCSTDIPGEEYQSKEFKESFMNARDCLARIREGG